MATFHTPIRKDISRALREKLLPWAQGVGKHQDRSTLTLILAQLPLRAPSDIRVEPCDFPPLYLSGNSRTYFTLTSWSEAAMIAQRFPTLGFVLEGEIDLRVGVVQTGKARGAVNSKTAASKILRGSGRLVTGIKAGSTFVVPPGVPYDGASIHWHRPHPEKAFSSIFWIAALPEGARCHICTTRGEDHSCSGWLLARDNHVNTLAELLIAELQNRAPHGEALAQSHLLSMLLHVDRALEFDKPIYRGEVKLHAKLVAEETPIVSRALVFERAQKYIAANLQHELSVAGVAAHAFVSSTQLNRVFQAEAQTSVMRFVTQERMKTAQFYLQHSDLPVGEIGKLVGHANFSQFSRAFTQWTGASPTQFRKNHKSVGNAKI